MVFETRKQTSKSERQVRLRDALAEMDLVNTCILVSADALHLQRHVLVQRRSLTALNSSPLTLARLFRGKVAIASRLIGAQKPRLQNLHEEVPSANHCSTVRICAKERDGQSHRPGTMHLRRGDELLAFLAGNSLVVRTIRDVNAMIVKVGTIGLELFLRSRPAPSRRLSL